MELSLPVILIFLVLGGGKTNDDKEINKVVLTRGQQSAFGVRSMSQVH